MIYLVGIVLYLIFLIGIGVYKSRVVKTQDDFMVASRSVSALFLASTLICTSVGSGILFGGAGRAFRDGFSAMWMNLGGWAGMLGLYFLAQRVQRIAQYTAPDILEMRYTATARLLGTGAVVMAYLTIASYQFRGGGRLLHVLTGLDPIYGQVITCVLAALYTGLAGMLSIVALDIFNGVLIAGSALLAVPFVLKAAGGWSSMQAALPESHFYSFGSLGLLSTLGLFFPLFLQIVGDSGMYQKLMSAKDPKSARRGVLGMLVGVIPIQSALAAIGVIGAAIYWSDPAFVKTNGGFDAAATETIVLQVGRFDLPVVLGVALLCAAAAMIFSTANTMLMIPSTNLARDVYQRFVNPQASQRRIVLVQRVIIVVLAAISFSIASFFDSILDMALYAYTMVGAAVTPALLAAFLWRRVTALGGTVSVGAGMAVTISYAVLDTLGVTNFGYSYIIYPAVAASVISLVVVSLATSPSPEEKWRPFWPNES